MAHYAYIDENNIVVEVITGRDENDLIEDVSNWEDHYGSIKGLNCKRTSYTSRGAKKYDPETGEELIGVPHFRYNYAGIGFTYDENLDAFIPPKPNFGNFVFDDESLIWIEEK
jgi:hypothetical protein